MGGSSKQTIGYWFKYLLHYGLSRGPVDAVLEMRVGDRTAWAGRATSSQQVYVDQPNLFGGEKGEGGLQGYMDIMMGESTQLPNSYLAANMGPEQSGYRAKLTMLWRGGKFGAMNPYPKAVAFKVERILADWPAGVPWYPAKAAVSIAENRAPVAGDYPWVNRNTGVFVIGAAQETSGGYASYQGWWHGEIDSFRITKGVARYTSAEYAVPGADFGSSLATDAHYDSVVLLLRMEGADGSTVFVDEKGHGVASFGGAHITTARAKWGGSAGRFGGVNDWLEAIMGTDQSLGDSWTMDAWVWLETKVSDDYSRAIFGYGPLNQGNNDTTWYCVGDAWSFIQLEAGNLSRPLVSQNLAPYMETGRWVFVSVCRDGPGGLYYLHQDGKLITAGAGTNAMNPAHMLYESIIARVEDGGQGEPVGLINAASFTAAADKLYSEGFGLCTTWDGEESAEEFQDRICNVIGASLSQSRLDGQYYLDLIRDDYVLADLPIISEDDVIEFVEEPTNLSEAINQTQVGWFDPQAKENRVTPPLSSLGGIQAAGGVIAASFTHREIPVENIAMRVAARYMSMRSRPMSRYTLTTNRRPYALRPGKFFRLQMPSEGVADVVCLAGEIDYGELGNGRMKIVAVKDVFGLPTAVFVDPAPGVDVGSDLAPAASANQRVFEAPYVELAAALSRADLAAMPADAGYLGTVATRPAGMGLNYAIYTAADSEAYVGRGFGDWCPSALVVEAAAPLAVAFTLSGASDLDQVVVGSWALWGDEIVRVDAIDATAGTLTLGRGCADTVPATHAAGERIYFAGDWAGADGREYVDAEVVHAKLLTRTTSNLFAIAAAVDNTVTMDQRAFRPYPPGNFTINGAAYPTSAFGLISVAGAGRDRVLQADQLLATTAAAVGPEIGTTYTLRYYANGVLEQTVAGIASLPSTYTPVADCLLRVELEAVRDGLASWQFHSHQFSYTSSAPTFLLLESGNFLLLESGDKLILE